MAGGVQRPAQARIEAGPDGEGLMYGDDFSFRYFSKGWVWREMALFERACIWCTKGVHHYRRTLLQLTVGLGNCKSCTDNPTSLRIHVIDTSLAALQALHMTCQV